MKKNFITFISFFMTFVLLFSIVSICPFAETIGLGDTNGDGSIDMKDVLLLRKFIAGQDVQIIEDACDVNADDEIDLKDLLAVRKYIAKQDVSFSTKATTETSTTIASEVTSMSTETTTTTLMTTTTTTQTSTDLKEIVTNRPSYIYGEDGVPYLNFRQNTDGTTLGTWWWWTDQGFDAKYRDMYLDFLKKNGVTEIYFYGYDFLGTTSGNTKLHGFVEKANEMGMGVALINEDVGITVAGNTIMKKIVSNYLSYVKQYPDDNMLGIHFDVEHVGVDLFANNMVSQFDYARENGVPIAMDVNCEMDIDTQLTVGDVTGNIYEVIAAHTTTLTLMSYRDSYEAIMKLGDAAYKAALKYNCKLVFAVETGRYDFNPEDWEFFQETKEYMYDELKKVYLDLIDNHPSAGFGLAVHQHEDWYYLSTIADRE